MRIVDLDIEDSGLGCEDSGLRTWTLKTVDLDFAVIGLDTSLLTTS